jgi:predicted AAA+ superfamily ATPase
MDKLYPRRLEPPAGSFFLFGVRGVGKSTWVRQALPGAVRVDLLDDRLFQQLLATPGHFADMVRRHPRGSVIVVDEIQRIPALLNEVHRAIEERRDRFVLLGSSARRLKAAGTNLLAGRAVQRTLLPLLPSELGEDFDLDTVLAVGSVPLIWTSADREATLEAYVQTYLREEIRAEALVRNLSGFVRFLPVAALLHGQVVNVSGIGRDAGVSRTTINGYLDILEDTLLAVRLPAYEARLRVRERRHPKLYWVDPGIVRAAKGHFGPVAPEERGALFEGWVFGILRAHNEARRLYDDIACWAPTQAKQTEVDFLLRRGRRFAAIEVKSQSRYSARLTVGLQAVAGLRGLERRILVYRGSMALTTEDGIEVWPVGTLLDAVERGTL